ncbi:MAG: phospholipid carrier-dependent glycosyltransferase [Candidatus Peribacteraceae bacterium]|nr:phospholipid carrier-dependent glycosyltransferase [Candidatus Peribacteraceae bacterium]
MPVRHLTRWLPETALLLILAFFALRELHTFPAAWLDDSLFMIVARALAEGHGYVLPLLGYDWPNPYILAVGPTLIGPAALSIKLFGTTVAAARIPMVIYLFLTAGTFFLYARMLFGRRSALWATTLVITLSAFVNTGKPVLGEVPAFFFLMLGLLCLHLRCRSAWFTIATGIAFGLSVVTKLPYGLIFPALAVAAIFVAWKRQWHELRTIVVIWCIALFTLLAFAPFLGALEPGFFREINIFVFGGGDDLVLMNLLRRDPFQLLRVPYLHYSLFFILGGVGFFRTRKEFSRTEAATIGTLIALFALYFLNGAGWYRQLLPSTLLLTLAVPSGAFVFLGKRLGITLLIVIMALQGWWQYTYRGSSRSTEAENAAKVVSERFRDTDLVFLAPDVFFRLDNNPHWLYQSIEMEQATRRPAEVSRRMEETQCWPVVNKVTEEQKQEWAKRLTPLSGRYFVIAPPSPCPQS